MRHRTIVRAFRAAVYDTLTARDAIGALDPELRIDGRVCLVTGANSGLGKAVAVDLAARGGRVIMACRSGHPEAGNDVIRISGSHDVEMLRVDLADVESVHRLCDELRDRRIELDIVVLNAGLMTRTARRSRQGYDLMFAVHFLANRIMLDRWLADGVIQPRIDAGDADVPRIVVVTSETHRSSDPIDFDAFGEYVDYGMRDGLKYYGLSKLHSCTFANELDRRLNPDGVVRVAVHAACPGPIATNIAREAPLPLKVVFQPLMKLFFASPAKAARPICHLCCAGDAGQRSGIYLHMMRETEPSAMAMDPGQGSRLWQASQALVDRHVPEASGPRYNLSPSTATGETMQTVKVVFPDHLTSNTGGVREIEVECRNYRGLVRVLEERWPGIEEVLTKTAVAINGQIYQDAWLEPIAPGSEVFFMERIEGG